MDLQDKYLISNVKKINSEIQIPKIYKLKRQRIGLYYTDLKDWQIENNFDTDNALSLNEIDKFISTLSRFELEDEGLINWIKDLDLEFIYINTKEGLKLADYFFFDKFITEEEFINCLEVCEDILHLWKSNLFRDIDVERKALEEVAKFEKEEATKQALENFRFKSIKNEADSIKRKHLEKIKRIEKEEAERLANYTTKGLFLTNEQIKHSRENQKFDSWEDFIDIHIKENKIQLTAENRIELFKLSSSYLSSYTRKAFETRITLLKYFNFEQNLNILFQSRETEVDWKCDLNHFWKTTLRKMEDRKKGCLDCSGMRERIDTRNSDENYLYKIAPELEEQYHPDNKTEFKKLTAGSARKVKWVCPKNSKHVWEALVFSRVNGSGCSICSPKSRSLNEIKILFELSNFYKLNFEQKGFRSEGVNYFPDILINSHRVVIEYDGSYWHKKSQLRDERKNNYFNSIGYKVIRLREYPLKKIDEKDIVINIKGTLGNDEKELKKAVNHILKLYPPIGTNYQTYIKNKKLLKKKAANEYYNKI